MRFKTILLLFSSMGLLTTGCQRATYTQQAPTFEPPALPGDRPWSQQPFFNDPQAFQFAIVADRTGGMRPGVFAEAVKKINLLQPEFVMSVGDLIDGYTQDSSVVARQWQEFEDIIAGLNAPFFYVPGNHDISNAMMADAWKQRLGRTYYYFLYKNVLFLCLNTEDPPATHISDAQVAYFREVLAQHPDVQWTLVFMHKPLWSYENQAGYEKIAALLQNRPHTVFSGHLHNYLKSKKPGAWHYHLGTTGGVSALRGERYGEFDHIVWVTMTAGGPQVANLALSGILPDDVVSDATYPLVDVLRRGAWWRVSPAVAPQRRVTSLTTRLIFENPNDLPLRVTGTLTAKEELLFSPQVVDTVIAARSKLTLPVALTSQAGLDLGSITQLPLELTGAYRSDSGEPLALRSRKRLLLEWRHVCRRMSGKAVIDADFAEWENSRFLDCRWPQQIQEGWNWEGPDDASFRFATGWDDDNLYLALESFDDRVIAPDDRILAIQDKFIVHLAAALRAGSPDAAPTPAEGTKTSWRLEIAPGGAAFADGSRLPEGAAAACRQTATGLRAEIEVPLTAFGLSPDWKSFRLNVGVMDHDETANTKASVLWWRPLWGGPVDYPGSGTFDKK